VPSAAIAKDLVALFLTRYDASRVVGLHQKEEVWFAKPARLGQTLTLSGTYVDKYQKRGKGYVVLDCEARDEAGDLIVRQQSTEIMRIPEKVELGAASSDPKGGRVEPVWPANIDPAARAGADLAPGTPVRPLTKRARQDQMAVFSGVGKQWHNIHTDDRVAKAAGFRDTIAQGMMETCWTAEMLAHFFGPPWLASGWIRMIYTQPVYNGDTITCRAVVKDRKSANGATQLHLEVWAENQDGRITTVGWASGRVI
jgi:acyl dehydratase